jgi:hypothetical protein
MQTLSTLILTCFAVALWLGGNIILGNVAALEHLHVLDNVNWYWRWVVAASPSALQLYLSKNWSNPDSMLARMRVFGLGAGILVIVIDIGGPALGMLAVSGYISPWSWLYFSLALVPAFLCSWWSQEVAVNGIEQLWAALGRVLARQPVEIEELVMEEAGEIWN